jgi:hypothetical protein
MEKKTTTSLAICTIFIFTLAFKTGVLQRQCYVVPILKNSRAAVIKGAATDISNRAAIIKSAAIATETTNEAAVIKGAAIKVINSYGKSTDLIIQTDPNKGTVVNVPESHKNTTDIISNAAVIN